MKKIVVVGAGEIAKNALATVFRIFPKDQEVDILLLNRSKDKAEVAYLDASLEKDEISFSENVKVTSSAFNFRASSEVKDFYNADVIIFTAGVAAASLGSTDREFALPFVYKLICDYAEHIKRYAPEAFILMITNPVDVTTLIMQDSTGFPPERVLGFGCDLDSRRFIRSFREELEKIDIKTKAVRADVIGGHSEKDMIIPIKSIIIDGLYFDEFRKKFPDQQVEKIDSAFKIADQKMREEGFRIVKGGFKAGIAPVTSLAFAARTIMFGNILDDELFMTCSQVLTPERSYCGITDSCISVPVKIKFKESRIYQHKYLISDIEKEELIKVSEKHKSLFSQIKSMPFDLYVMLTKNVDAFKEKKAQSEEALALYLREAAKAKERVSKTSKATVSLLQVIKNDPCCNSYSKVVLGFKNELKGLFSIEARSDMMNNMCDYFEINGVENVQFDPERQCISLPNTKAVKNLLQNIQIVPEQQSRL